MHDFEMRVKVSSPLLTSMSLEIIVFPFLFGFSQALFCAAHIVKSLCQKELHRVFVS